MWRGEALGRRWQDKFFADRALRVEHTVGPQLGRSVIKLRLQTEAAVCTIAVDATIMT